MKFTHKTLFILLSTLTLQTIQGAHSEDEAQKRKQIYIEQLQQKLEAWQSIDNTATTLRNWNIGALAVSLSGLIGIFLFYKSAYAESLHTTRNGYRHTSELYFYLRRLRKLLSYSTPLFAKICLASLQATKFTHEQVKELKTLIHKKQQELISSK